MRRRSALAVVVGLALGCSPSDTSVAADVESYLSRAQMWASVESDAARTIERILETQFVDEAEVRRQIGDARPRVVAHLESVRKYVPRTAAVERIHRRYVVAWEELLKAFDDIERGFSSGDYTLLARGREEMARWKEGVVGVARELRRLVEEHDIELAPPVPS
jgi:hypothetical protein